MVAPACRRRRVTSTAVLALLLAAIAVRSARADEVIDRVLAVVAGDLIMQSDVTSGARTGARERWRRCRSGSRRPVAADRPRVDSRRGRAIRAAGAGARRDRSSVSRRACALCVRRGFFQSRFARVGFDEKQLRAILRQNLRIRAYLDQRFAGETPERGAAIIAAWVAGLRSRATILDLYAPH